MKLVDAAHSKCATFGFVGSSPTAPTTLMETYTRLPLRIKRGKGCWIWDENNTKYLDAVSGIATCCLGHSDRALRKSLTLQLRKIQHVSNLYEIPEQEELADWLVSNSSADKVFFCNSGAEANEAAIKIAKKYGNSILKKKDCVILAAKGSFHGRTVAAISATGQSKYQKGFEPMLEGFEFFDYNNWDSFENLTKGIKADKKSISAVIIEPIQGEGGVIPGEHVFFRRLRNFCTDEDILLILDEVQTGMGRTGNLWGYENLGIEPDIFTTAKGLGGGHVIGAVLATNKASIFSKGEHASTFGGNPFACRAGITVAREIKKRNLLNNALLRGDQLKEGLHKIIKEFPNHFIDVRGQGLLQGLVISQNSPYKASEITKLAIKEKLLILPAGDKVIRLVPPLIIKKHEINFLLKRLKSTIKKFG